MDGNNNKILLVNPPYINALYASRRTAAIFPPLGLAYLAAHLVQNEKPVEIFDANALNISELETTNFCVNSDAGIIGFTAMTNTMPIVLRIAQEVKKQTRKTIILGGPHPTFTANEILSTWDFIDIVVRGEGESTIVELLKSIGSGSGLAQVNGISYRKNGDIVSNHDRLFNPDLDSLLLPARDLLPLDYYRPSCILDVKPVGQKYATVISSRGCINRCIYCSSSYFWKKFRTRSSENLITEIDHLLCKYDVERIDFLDDVFTWDKERLLEICHYLQKLKHKIRWSCYARVDRMSIDLAKEMKKAGCFAIQFGIESGNQEILNRVKKNITIAQVENAVDCVRQNNMKVMGDFMIGLPGETRTTILETLNFAIRLKLNLAFFSITTPFPGTELYKNYPYFEKTGRQNLFEAFCLHGNSQYRNENLTSSKIRELYQLCIRKFYLNPGYGLNLLKWLIRNPWDMKNYYQLFRAFLESRSG